MVLVFLQVGSIRTCQILWIITVMPSRIHSSVCARHCWCNISYSFFANGLKNFWYDDHWQNIELINFSWLWLNCQGHRMSLCFKSNFVYVIFLSFSPMAFKFSDMVTMDNTLNWLTFRDCGLIFKVTGGSLCFKINFIYTLFPVVLCWWLSN